MKGPAGVRIVLDGEVTVHGAADLRTMLLSTLDPAEEGQIEIELSEVSELDTAGLQLLLMVKRQAEQLGRTLLLVDPSATVTEVLSLAHLDHHLEPVIDPPPSRPVLLAQNGGI